ncbi:MAG: (2Fe-2S)-binding protein [Melioribacteraceae bacterium]|nr:(2Fe-2S)-binding protein [Melioribacteraceae bacterium]
MSKENKSKKLSRRDFIGRASTGAVGSIVLFPAISSGNDKREEKISKTNFKMLGTNSLTLKVNGKKISAKVNANTTLVELLRDHLNLTGTKVACNSGECGSCSVLLDGEVVYSCHMLALDAQGKSVTTVEGLMDGEKFHPVQEAFVEEDGLQCGFCTPGQVMAAVSLLNNNPTPTKGEVMNGMAGNICRCAAYPKIIDSVLSASKKMKV